MTGPPAFLLACIYEPGFGQTPDIDLAEPDPVPEFVFDQSVPDEFDD